MKRLLVLSVFLAGCAVGSHPQTGQPPSAAVEAPPEVQAPAPQENVAIAGLMESARADAAAGRLPNAAASLERALRIEPRNPRLWQELARVRLQQGDYGQAESLAQRSNTWSGTDNALRAQNWRLIAQARVARGDADGARKAQELADRLGGQVLH